MMHRFDDTEAPAAAADREVLALLTRVYELKGRTGAQMASAPATVETLCRVARIQSTEASNRIEGIITTGARLQALMEQKTTPRNRSEEEIAGYRDVLATVHEHYAYIAPTPNNILQMHRDLYAYSGRGGSWKDSDNVIAEIGMDGTRRIRFEPVPAYRTPEAMEALCSTFRRAMDEGRCEPLLLTARFVLDFLCIHPFLDGNGRMSRLLTTLLLYRSGFDVGRYISLEKLIDTAKAGYYEALQRSSFGWHENQSDDIPFVRYFLGILIKAYTELENRLRFAGQAGLSKSARIKALFDTSLAPLRKADIAERCPDISLITIERTLKALCDAGYLVRIGQGRATAYARNADSTGEVERVYGAPQRKGGDRDDQDICG